jgi:coenzyme F420-reducing hydrogenase beta subunit
MQEVMKKRAIELLSDGTVAKVIGWMPGEFSYDMTPAVFNTAEEIESNFVYNDFCGANVSKYVMREQKKALDAKILVFLKPCDTYSFNQLCAEHKIVRENVYVIGVGCDGMADVEKIKAAGITPEMLQNNRKHWYFPLAEEAQKALDAKINQYTGSYPQ